jgi:hypothetical protein
MIHDDLLGSIDSQPGVSTATPMPEVGERLFLRVQRQFIGLQDWDK